MLQGEHSAIFSTFIKLPFDIKIFVCLFLSGHLRQVLLYYQSVKQFGFQMSNVGLDLGPNCLQRLSADDKGKS